MCTRREKACQARDFLDVTHFIMYCVTHLAWLIAMWRIFIVDVLQWHIEVDVSQSGNMLRRMQNRWHLADDIVKLFFSL